MIHEAEPSQGNWMCDCGREVPGGRECPTCSADFSLAACILLAVLLGTAVALVVSH